MGTVMKAMSSWRASSSASSRLSPEENSEDKTIASVERRHILRVLNETLWQRGQAATILGIHRTTLANKIREYGLANA